MSQIKIQFINENKKVGLKNIYKISSSRENNLIKSENNQKKNIYILILETPMCFDFVQDLLQIFLVKPSFQTESNQK